MKRFALPIAVALLFVAAPAAAQDPTEIDSKHYQVVLENDDVRVLHITYGVGETSVMHEHPDAVFVSTTSNRMRMHLPDGSSVEMEITANEPMWTPAGAHRPENLSDNAISGYLIELKHSSAMHSAHMESMEHCENCEHEEHEEHEDHEDHDELPETE
jgi:hypothetical protein